MQGSGVGLVLVAVHWDSLCEVGADANANKEDDHI